MKKLAIITTHPIQYNAPWFKLLAERKQIAIKVFYTWSQAESSVKDRTFGKEIIWDIPLLEGYEHEFVSNVAKNPGSHHYSGIDCPTLIARVKAFGPDTILVFGWNFKSHLKVMRHFKGKVPIWFRGDSTLLDELPGVKTSLRRLVLKWVYRHVDKVLYVGKANRAYFLKHGLTEHQLIYAPHAIDNDRFVGIGNHDRKALTWKTELNLNSDDIVVLFAGKLEPKKQPDFLLSAVKKANDCRNKPLKLIFVGSGEMEGKLKTLSEGDDNIKFLPFQNQSQMPLVYRLGTILSLPSKGPGETWGLAINEAMASGTAVMATTKVGCVYDLIEPNSNGYIFAHDDLVELTQLLETLDLEALIEMGVRSQQKIKEWSFEHLVSNIENAMINE